jgi:hypothetical protein
MLIEQVSSSSCSRPFWRFSAPFHDPCLTPTRGHAWGPQKGAGQPLNVASPLAGIMTAAGRPLGLSTILDCNYQMSKMLAAIHERCWPRTRKDSSHVTSWVAFESWLASETPAA